MNFASLVFFILTISSFSFAATLQEAYQAALKKNERVGIENAQLTQARERVRQIRGGIFPQISANATYFMQPELDDPIAADFFPARQTTIALTAEQALFRGFREFAGLRQQNALVGSKEHSRNQALLLLYQDVASAYLTVLSTEQDIKNIDLQLNLNGSRVKELGSRVKTGESSATDLLTAQASEAALKAEAQILRGNLSIARENFAFLTGLSADEQLQDPELARRRELAPLDSYLKKIENRYDVKSLRAEDEAADEGIKIARGSHWPTLDLVGNYYLQRPPGFVEDLKWDVQLRLKMPLFEGGTTQSIVREATARKMETDLNLARARRDADKEVRSSYETFQARMKQVDALKISTELSERSYQRMLRDYRRGLVRNIDVQQALTDYRVSSRTFDLARFNAQLDYIRLQIASADLSAPEVKE